MPAEIEMSQVLAVSLMAVVRLSDLSRTGRRDTEEAANWRGFLGHYGVRMTDEERKLVEAFGAQLDDMIALANPDYFKG